MVEEKERKLGIWGKYLTIWVALCMVIGTLAGKYVTGLSDGLKDFSVADISIPIAICLFLMIYPIMVQISWEEIRGSLKSPKPLGLTLFSNWAIKPFTMALLAWLVLSVWFVNSLTPEQINDYRTGLILLGIAPCTAMVLMWSYLAKGNMGHTLVMTAVNSLTMVALYAPLAVLLLGVSGIVVPWDTIAISVAVYILTPLILGYITRNQVIKRRGLDWLETRLVPKLGRVSIIALLVTLILVFTIQGDVLFDSPGVIGIITIAILINILAVFGMTYGLAKLFKFSYQDAAPTALIAGSNHFEVAIAVALTLSAVAPGAALATVVGVLTEVPLMLGLVWVCKRTKGWFTATST
ncbi:MAG: ACR3 family arsenite efflux transporter [Chloroflexi bacterium]|nr:ACR3 family arsenite efflux transporter [Chloroflexota bacterium]MBT7080317.1 ACR3 family arsenite efflux transporter [Chloroflexota bacterium]MBT7289384.1 ACR3 family arsenite efflux transporter [Chloroflexota bacterium]